MKNKKLNISIKIYIGFIIIFAIVGAINVFLPQGTSLKLQETTISKPKLAIINGFIILIFYGGLGLIGIKLSEKLGFANLWDPKSSNKERLLIPIFVGGGIGFFFILADIILTHYLGTPLPHPPFPTSLIASISAAIGEEIIFRLFFISSWVWFLSSILRGKWQNQIFWIVSIFSAITFGFAHLPSVMILLGLNSLREIPSCLFSGIILLNGILSIFTAYFFRKNGFLTAVEIHFWTDVIWHVIWGLIK
ncbi:MAG: CPBP family glutamic-type intramembrane protease [candidate division WOR-3 bacterium]